MTQSELSRRAGVSLGSLKRFEQTEEISFVSLLKTADVLGELPAFEELFERQVDQSIEEVIDERNRKNKSKIEEIVDTERKDIIDSYRGLPCCRWAQQGAYDCFSGKTYFSLHLIP